jgi:hypothetical protein
VVTYSTPSARLQANATTLHLRLSWSAIAPQEVDYRFVEANGRGAPLRGIAPSSPFVIDAPPAILTAGTDYLFEARPNPAGAVVEETVAVDLWYS